MMRVDYFADFKAALTSNIEKEIAKLKRAGVVAMSPRNLLAVTPTPRTVAGPVGTNAQWVYAQMFNEAIESLPPRLRRFVEVTQ